LFLDFNDLFLSLFLLVLDWLILFLLCRLLGLVFEAFCFPELDERSALGLVDADGVSVLREALLISLVF